MTWRSCKTEHGRTVVNAMGVLDLAKTHAEAERFNEVLTDIEWTAEFYFFITRDGFESAISKGKVEAKLKFDDKAITLDEDEGMEVLKAVFNKKRTYAGLMGKSYNAERLAQQERATTERLARMEKAAGYLGLVKIPEESFVMGSPANENDRSVNGTQHRVTISKPFWMGKHEVTQAQREAVMGNNLSLFKGAKRPVENISWDEAIAF